MWMGSEEWLKGIGYQKRLGLGKRWNEQHTDLPSNHASLSVKFRRLENASRRADKGNDSEDESENEVDHVNEGESDTPEGDPPETLVRELERFFAEAKAGGEGNLKQRSVLWKRKWRGGGNKNLGMVDKAMMEVWSKDSEKTVWELNCLTYAGAAVTLNLEEDIPTNEVSRISHISNLSISLWLFHERSTQIVNS